MVGNTDSRTCHCKKSAYRTPLYIGQLQVKRLSSWPSIGFNSRIRVAFQRLRACYQIRHVSFKNAKGDLHDCDNCKAIEEATGIVILIFCMGCTTRCISEQLAMASMGHESHALRTHVTCFAGLACCIESLSLHAIRFAFAKSNRRTRNPDNFKRLGLVNRPAVA